jgi:hypothetical protein
VVDDEDADSIPSWVEERIPNPSLWSRLKVFFMGGNSNVDNLARAAEAAAGLDESQEFNVTPMAQLYYPDRKLIYDGVKSTREASLTVTVEQVSIFLMDDGTVITFFQVRFWNC